MLKIKEVNIPIFNQTIYFIFGDPAEVKDYLRDVYCGDFSFDENLSDAVVLHKDLSSWIWFDLSRITVPIICHEIDHAVYNLMEDLGLDITDQEAFCYLDEFIMEQCVNLFAIQMDPSKALLESKGKEDEQALSSIVKENL